jgi:hypothetical protein
VKKVLGRDWIGQAEELPTVSAAAVKPAARGAKD